MLHKITIRFTICMCCSLPAFSATAQSILPPAIPWSGKSESLVTKPNDPWITTAERSNFVSTPGYKETMNWFNKLAAASPLLTMISIGKSIEGRDIFMIIASTEKNITAASMNNPAASCRGIEYKIQPTHKYKQPPRSKLQGILSIKKIRETIVAGSGWYSFRRNRW